MYLKLLTHAHSQLQYVVGAKYTQIKNYRRKVKSVINNFHID